MNLVILSDHEFINNLFLNKYRQTKLKEITYCFWNPKVFHDNVLIFTWYSLNIMLPNTPRIKHHSWKISSENVWRSAIFSFEITQPFMWFYDVVYGPFAFPSYIKRICALWVPYSRVLPFCYFLRPKISWEVVKCFSS